MSTVKSASPLKGDKYGLLKGCKQLLNFKYEITHSMHFPLNFPLIIAKEYLPAEMP